MTVSLMADSQPLGRGLAVAATGDEWRCMGMTCGSDWR